MSDHEKIQIARENGIMHPALVFEIAERVGIPFWAACAFLVQETGGGRNVWGHDDTWMIGYPVMSAEVYAVYKTHRDRFGNQGVGPMQLTSAGFQDEADRAGGCWEPEANMLVAFKFLASLRQSGLSWHDVAKRYNGSDSYAEQMDERFTTWRELLNQ